MNVRRLFDAQAMLRRGLKPLKHHLTGAKGKSFIPIQKKTTKTTTWPSNYTSPRMRRSCWLRISWIELNKTVQKCVRKWNKKWKKKIETRTFNLLGISRICIMRIYLLGRRTPIESDETASEVVACGVVVGSSLIVLEVVFERWAAQFLGKQVGIVQE